MRRFRSSRVRDGALDPRPAQQSRRPPRPGGGWRAVSPGGEARRLQRGRITGSDQDYTAKGDARTNAALVVLVDRNSASASEIVSGCVQDHDRGLVVGETTFGKGLVQPDPLRDGGALALTTAKYYTPSGRLIQRDYSNLDDYFSTPSWKTTCASFGRRGITNHEVRRTDSGRTVYGAGITPDYVVRASASRRSSRASPRESSVRLRGAVRGRPSRSEPTFP